MIFLMLMASCKRKIEKLIDCDEVALKSITEFKMGVAVETSKLSTNQAYRQKVLLHFNSITPESEMKFSYLMPQPNNFYWKGADQLVEFANANNLQLHGHTLIWGEHLPDWVYAYNGDWQLLYKYYIQEVVLRYKGKVKAWDVANEAFDDEGILKDNIWKQKIGDSYISLAFRYAREADPDALLFINEVNLESKIKKLSAVVYFAKKLMGEGIKVDGIGLQMHVAHNFPSDRQIENVMKIVSGAGFKVHVSELDVAVNGNNSLTKPSFHTLKEQKKRVKTIVSAFNALPAEHRYAISLWGLSDADSWLRKQVNPNEWPLLFDEELNIKPAFCGFLEGLD